MLKKPFPFRPPNIGKPEGNKNGEEVDPSSTTEDALGPAPPASPANLVPAQQLKTKAPPKGKDATSLILKETDSSCKFIVSPLGDAYVETLVDGSTQTLKVRSPQFRKFVRFKFYAVHKRSVSGSVIDEVIETLDARCCYEGVKKNIYNRVAEQDGRIYIDLGGQSGGIIEITPSDWHMLTGASPVNFIRSDSQLPLPMPAMGGGLRDLRGVLNIGSDEDLILVISWLIRALSPSGPYPILILGGEQGSAKTGNMQTCKMIIDPTVSLGRLTPSNERDLFIGALNSWVLCFDNLSSCPPWLSDALCLISTEGTFSARKLYSDDAEVLFKVMRPIILTGISDLATRPDLAERSLVMTLPVIPKSERKSD